jgi:hypothetical protein
MNRKKLNRKKNLQSCNDLSRWEVCMALLLTAESTIVLNGLLYKNSSNNNPYLESETGYVVLLRKLDLQASGSGGLQGVQRLRTEYR